MSRRRKLMMLFFSYSAIVKAFSERTIEDSGVVENATCVDDKLKL